MKVMFFVTLDFVTLGPKKYLSIFIGYADTRILPKSKVRRFFCRKSQIRLKLSEYHVFNLILIKILHFPQNNFRIPHFRDDLFFSVFIY